MAWGKKVIRGVEYDLSHLDSAVIDVTPKEEGAEPYRVLVSYGCHCFARELRPGDHLDFHIIDGSNTRCFCPDRTGLSRHLPKIIREAAGGLAFFSEGTHMLLVEEIDGQPGPYAVFFNVEKAKEKQKGLDAVMFVVSAYVKPELPERLPSVPFVSLIDKASKGHKPFKPLRTKLWKKKKEPNPETK